MTSAISDARLRWREALPIVTRELRVAAKRRLTYRLRWIVALIGGLGVITAAMLARDYSVEVGQFVFWFTAAIMVVICASAGLLLTADSVSREKRDGTLGLLFLTRLNSADIILGKLTAGGLSGCGVAFAGLPFLAFSLCLGGVTAEELFKMSAALLFLLGYSLTIGIFVSTLFRREGIVTLAFLCAMLGPVALTPFVFMKSAAIPNWLALTNPLFPALTIADGRTKYFATAGAWQPILFQTAAMAAMLLASFIILPWNVRSTAVSNGGKLKKVVLRSPRARRALKTDFSCNPVYALSRRHGRAVALLAVCAGLYGVVGFAASTRREAEITFLILMAILPKFFVLWTASGAMAAEKQNGFLETLLTTPLSGGEILRDKVRAIRSQVAPALILALVALWTISTGWWGASGGMTIEATLGLAAMISLIIDVISIGWVALWQGLLARDRRRALLWATTIGLIVPWVIPTFGIGLISWMLDGPSWLNEPADALPLIMISANVISFAIAVFAMARIHDKFRSSGTQTWQVVRSIVSQKATSN